MRLEESKINPLNILDGAIGHVNSCVKLVIPMAL
jgi:hypothetical protein